MSLGRNMQERMGEVSASAKQDRLPQLFLINKFPGPFEFFRRGEEHPRPQRGEGRKIMDHMVHMGQRPHGAGRYMGVSGTGRTQSWEVTGTKAMAAYSHHRSPVTCCLPDSGLGPCHKAPRGQGYVSGGH